MKLITAICSFIVRRALKDDTLRALIEAPLRDVINDLEESVQDDIEDAIEEHCQDVSHIDETEIERLMENFEVSPDEIRGLDRFVEDIIEQTDINVNNVVDIRDRVLEIMETARAQTKQ